MRKKILIIDEDALNRRFFSDVLVSEGFDTVVAEADGAAPSLAIAERPDLIVMDMCALNDDAIATTRAMKLDKRLEGVPVIGVTAIARAIHHEEVRATGCDDCLQKPVTVDGFLRSVHRHLN